MKKCWSVLTDDMHSCYITHLGVVHIHHVFNGSHEDRQKAKAYLFREMARTSSCNKRCKAIRRCLTPKAENTGQMSLKDFGIG